MTMHVHTTITERFFAFLTRITVLTVQNDINGRRALH